MRPPEAAGEDVLVVGANTGRRLNHRTASLIPALSEVSGAEGVANPEPRYTLECYPVVIVCAAAFLSRDRAAAAI